MVAHLLPLREPCLSQGLLCPVNLSTDPSKASSKSRLLQTCTWKPLPQLACAVTCALGQLQEQMLVKGTHCRSRADTGPRANLQALEGLLKRLGLGVAHCGSRTRIVKAPRNFVFIFYFYYLFIYFCCCVIIVSFLFFQFSFLLFCSFLFVVCFFFFVGGGNGGGGNSLFF